MWTGDFEHIPPGLEKKIVFKKFHAEKVIVIRNFLIKDKYTDFNSWEAWKSVVSTGVCALTFIVESLRVFGFGWHYDMPSLWSLCEIIIITHRLPAFWNFMSELLIFTTQPCWTISVHLLFLYAAFVTEKRTEFHCAF
jgi:hypothetical protein